MVAPKNRQEARLQELILSAKRMNIHVRTEKLLREAGYRAKSGSCRVNGRDLILIDRDARLSDQIEFLTSELAERQADSDHQSSPCRPARTSPRYLIPSQFRKIVKSSRRLWTGIRTLRVHQGQRRGIDIAGNFTSP